MNFIEISTGGWFSSVEVNPIDIFFGGWSFTDDELIDLISKYSFDVPPCAYRTDSINVLGKNIQCDPNSILVNYNIEKAQIDNSLTVNGKTISKIVDNINDIEVLLRSRSRSFTAFSKPILVEDEHGNLDIILNNNKIKNFTVLGSLIPKSNKIINNKIIISKRNKNIVTGSKLLTKYFSDNSNTLILPTRIKEIKVK